MDGWRGGAKPNAAEIPANNRTVPKWKAQLRHGHLRRTRGETRKKKRTEKQKEKKKEEEENEMKKEKENLVKKEV